jgi:hypothetical protein
MKLPQTEKSGGVWSFAKAVRLIPEANIQAEFYHCCRLRGIHCVLEYITPVGRLDVSILNRECTHLLAIVECKSNEYGAVNLNSRQMQRYRHLGVPIYGLASLADVEYVVSEVFSKHYSPNAPSGIALSDISKITPLRRRKIYRSKLKKIPPELDSDFTFREV